ncbi:TPA: bifunctional oligoribonuclease/PAP phosphatase NrnA [Enterococcus faecium]|uniref:DHH family phosphoesterase n=1 Tax=Enterococcus faecium TaxID=1352 RepID=UPI0012622C6A|nr:bifunctional oligoribonuclease/PAP phosphatase NrnA [Enterococcus faecium]KAB7570955.1 bifunctional oligoribonuclease/PAP phosphatase NrnA [Enterococcus faecium]HAP6410801.1 bifunctional oligoribonuclease/PAP phosphatase NrnA [Enterococcus faecium]HAP6413695.1 bifunctional oligoribonuclease/PAP phosphatase NrnA [Enterococcus faecium]HAP6419567.1 bifunctional oligoribonuclease/PAP phosphatase NrnA [Enterococcus faecium]HAP6422460.1 bifunctional oligoribonuclease/PAP phosphatase NrnA [Enteroc
MTVQQEIVDTIKKYDKIIIHRHLRPDPDALGSQVGLAELLRESFPEKEIRQVGETIEGLRFLAEMQEVEDVFYQGALVIVTDTANSPRISDQRYQLAEKLIKIDHHPNDDPYGDLVWVNTKASSCSEMIAEFALMFPESLKMNVKAARLLYAGIVGDTGRFLYPSTTSRTLEIASILRNYPFDASALNREIEQMPMKVAKLSGYLYQNIQVDENGAGRIILPQEILDKYGIDDSETASIVSLPGVIDEVLASGIFVQQPSGYYRVRLRSKGPIINELAKRHHGGGHPLASGANAKDLAEVEEIYKEIQDICQSYKSRKTE